MGHLLVPEDIFNIYHSMSTFLPAGKVARVASWKLILPSFRLGLAPVPVPAGIHEASPQEAKLWWPLVPLYQNPAHIESHSQSKESLLYAGSLGDQRYT